MPFLLSSLNLVSLTKQMEKTLLNEMHRVGINLRFLGLVYLHANTERLKTVSMTEMVARCIKSQLRAQFVIFARQD